MPQSKRILVVEDDRAIRRGITDALTFEGYAVTEADRGDLGMDLAAKGTCDLVLLDLVLPGPDGLEILREVRRVKPGLPVIILTARGDEADRVRGLKLGADDYVVKPFSLRELLARVEAVLRRVTIPAPTVNEIPLPCGVADLNRREIRFHDGGRCDLSELETEILRFLAANDGQAHSREEILQGVWGLDPEGLATRTVDMHIVRLREKLRDHGPGPRSILTVRGKGYMFAIREDRI